MEKASETERLQQKMFEIYRQSKETKRIDTSEIMRELEPLFQAYGYRKTNMETPQRILLLHDDGVGDFINCSPAIREVRRAYPKAYITLFVYERSRDLALTCPYVDQVLTDTRKCDWQNALDVLHWNIELAGKLLPMHYDLSFHFTTWGSSVLLSYFSGAARRVGYDPSGFSCPGPFPYPTVSGFVTERVPCKLRGLHSLYRYLPMIEYMTGKVTADCHPELWMLSGEVRRWKEKLHQEAPDAEWFAVVLGATSERRHWPVASYAVLLQSILEEEHGRDIRFLLIGGPENKVDGDTLARELPVHTAWNVAGEMNYRESTAALSCCCCYIGNDTGLMHAAAAAHLPVLTPNCYAADLPMTLSSNPSQQYPFGVVMVLPAHALPECRDAHHPMGCAQRDKPHCITQVTPDLMMRGYHVLKEQIRQGRTNLLFLYEMDNPTHDGTVTAIEPLDVSRFEIEDA